MSAALLGEPPKAEAASVAQARVTPVGLAAKKARLRECGQNLCACLPVKAPQTPGLFFRQTQSGHLEEFAANAADDLIGAHRAEPLIHTYIQLHKVREEALELLERNSDAAIAVICAC